MHRHVSLCNFSSAFPTPLGSFILGPTIVPYVVIGLTIIYINFGVYRLNLHVFHEMPLHFMRTEVAFLVTFTTCLPHTPRYSTADFHSVFIPWSVIVFMLQSFFLECFFLDLCSSTLRHHFFVMISPYIRSHYFKFASGYNDVICIPKINTSCTTIWLLFFLLLSSPESFSTILEGGRGLSKHLCPEKHKSQFISLLYTLNIY